MTEKNNMNAAMAVYLQCFLLTMNKLSESKHVRCKDRDKKSVQHMLCLVTTAATVISFVINGHIYTFTAEARVSIFPLSFQQQNIFCTSGDTVTIRCSSSSLPSWTSSSALSFSFSAFIQLVPNQFSLFLFSSSLDCAQLDAPLSTSHSPHPPAQSSVIQQHRAGYWARDAPYLCLPWDGLHGRHCIPESTGKCWAYSSCLLLKTTTSTDNLLPFPCRSLNWRLILIHLQRASAIQVASPTLNGKLLLLLLFLHTITALLYT